MLIFQAIWMGTPLEATLHVKRRIRCRHLRANLRLPTLQQLARIRED